MPVPANVAGSVNERKVRHVVLNQYPASLDQAPSAMPICALVVRIRIILASARSTPSDSCRDAIATFSGSAGLHAPLARQPPGTLVGSVGALSRKTRPSAQERQVRCPTRSDLRRHRVAVLEP